MPTNYRRASDYLQTLLKEKNKEEWKERLSPKPGASARKEIRQGSSLEAFQERWEQLASPSWVRENLADPKTMEDLHHFKHNVENCVGTVKVPVGIAGPLRVNGLFAQGDFYIPLAATEAALVASYNRGCKLITEAGGCAALLLNEGISRAPGFAFRHIREAAEFVAWAAENLEKFRVEAEKTTRHGKLIDMKITFEGNHVYLNFEYTTGDAAGQNMATIATDAVCRYILSQCPVKPRTFFLEANLSGDKKASALSFLTVRGKKVTAEALLPAALVEKILRTTPERMCAYYRLSSAGAVLSGAMGIQGHYANALAAFYIATGQDAACVSESSVGFSRLETTPEGDLYASVTLPNLVVGTVGGGTGLPSQQACLAILALPEEEKTRALAEVCASLCLAGELSIIGALASGDFSRAHEILSRGKKREAE